MVVKLRQKILANFAAQAEVTTSYSASMRELRNKDPEKAKIFLKAFKKAFDIAMEEKIQDGEQAALLEALQFAQGE